MSKEHKDSYSEKLPPFEIRMKNIENYFKYRANEREAFIPEFEAAQKINQIALKEDVTEDDLIKIVEIFNQTNERPHYNGTGWTDYRFHIQFLIKKMGLDYKTLSNYNIEIINSNLPDNNN